MNSSESVTDILIRTIVMAVVVGIFFFVLKSGKKKK